MADAALIAGALDRCHQRWHALWLGVMARLKREEPRAYRRICRALEKHELINFQISSSRTGPRGHRGQPFPQGNLTEQVPSDSILQGARAFENDSSPTSLRGHTRGRPPATMVLWAFTDALETARKLPQSQRLPGISAAETALKNVADRFGYSHENCRKIIKEAKRRLRPEDRKRFVRAGGSIPFPL
jgi:hypothetical protein